MFPAIAGLSAVIGGVYYVGKAKETRRFWDDYQKNTGVTPRYRYRSGFYTYGNYAKALGSFSYGYYGLRRNVWYRW